MMSAISLSISVNLRFLTTTQIVEFVFEGETHRFSVVSVSSRRDAELAANFNSLSLDAPSQLWIAGWDMEIHVIASQHDPGVEVHKPNGPSLDAYTSVGGLDKQIAQIRDLLEIPLTRPDLFRELGSYASL
jgi:AAA family ATPase